jgi:hypothetical protein
MRYIPNDQIEAFFPKLLEELSLSTEVKSL